MKLKCAALLFLVCISFLHQLALGQNYAGAVNYGAHVQPLGIAKGDFNRDGNLDVVVADSASASLSLFLGNGDGTFGNAIPIAVGSIPFSLATADFNGDGNLDIVVSLQSASTFQVMYGNGNGTFQTPITVPVFGGTIGQIVIADFNGDHNPDLAIATAGGIAVVMDSSNGGLGQSFTAAPSSTIDALAVADINGDGRPDFIGIADSTDANGTPGGSVFVALGNGDGTFQAPTSISQFIGIPAGIAVGDINKDGLLDIVVSNFGGTIGGGGGGGGLGCTPRICPPQDVPPPPPLPINIPGSILVFLQQSDRTFRAGNRLLADGNPGYIALADLNGDGFLDIADASSSVNAILVNLGHGDGTFSAPNSLALPSLPAVIAPGSYTNNVAVDLAVTDPSTNEISVFVNQGANSLSLASSSNPSQVAQPVILTATVRPKFAAGGAPSGSVIFADGAKTLGSAPVDPSGTSKLTTSFASTGAHPLLAVFGGSSSLVGGSSATVTQTVNPAVATIILVSSPNPSSFGQTVTFNITATTLGSSIPTGIVNLTNGSSIILSGSLDAAGRATLSTSSLPIGNTTLMAQYAGDANFAPAISAPLTQSVAKGATLTALTGTPNPSVVGQSVSFNVNVTPSVAGASIPTGNVTLSDGTSALATAPLDANGFAAFSQSSLSVGTHSLSATYGGSAVFAGSTSTVFIQNVNKSDTAAVLSSSPNPSGFGQPVQITATVSPIAGGVGIPTGTVAFTDGANSIGSATLAGGKATVSVSALAVGAHSISANYGGDTTFNPSSASGAGLITQTVSKSATSAVLTTFPNPSGFGQSVTLTATITANGGSGAPSGQVTFDDGTASLGSATLTAGTASLSVSSLSAGSHSITASYAGDANFSGSNSAANSQTVTKATSATSLSGSPNPAALGQAVTLTATVAASSGSGIPSGTVTFSDAAGPLGTASLDATGKAVISTNFLLAGAHNLTAAYAGDSNFLPSTGTGPQTISKSPSATTVSATPNPSSFGQPVVFNVSVVAAGGGSGIPTGTVTISEGLNPIATATLDNTGKAAFSVGNLSGGSHNITASYAGDGNFNPSSASGAGSVSLVVSRSNTSSALSSSSNPTVLGQAITFTVRVVSSLGANVVPSGSVSFSDTSSVVGTAYLDGTGTATITLNSLLVGIHAITANYAGTSNFNASSSNLLSQTVNKNSTTVTLGSAPNPSAFGQSVVFTAQVAASSTGVGGASSIPTGSVTLTDGATVLSTLKLDSNGAATFSTSTLSAGIHSITSTYGGDANLSAGSSAPYMQTINKAATSTILAASMNPTTNASGVTFTVSVAAQAGVPTGTITLFDGNAQIGASQVDQTGKAALQISRLSTGTHHLAAAYGGDSGFAASLSPEVDEGVVDSRSGIVLTSSANPQTVNQPVIFVATVSLALGEQVKTGTVTFFDGQQMLGAVAVSGSVVSETINSLMVGTHQISATYQATSSPGPFDGTSTVLSQAINAAPPQKQDFSLTLHDTTATINAGQVFNTRLTLTPINGLTGKVVTTCMGAPAGATCTITPSSAIFDGKSPLSASLVITTSGQGTGYADHGDNREQPKPGTSVPVGISMALIPLAGCVLLPSLKAKRRGLFAIIALVVSMTACGGGSNGGGSHNPTPDGTYRMTVISQAGSVTHTRSLQLTVK
jgi:hypothetical protein